MKLSNLSIKYSVMILLVSIITPFFFLFAVMNYNSIRSGILDNAQLAVSQTRLNIVDTIVNTEKSYELVSTYYEGIMTEGLQEFKSQYESQNGDVTAINLAVLKEAFDDVLDFYIIDENGVIIDTTHPPVLGLDFKTVPDFYQTLTDLRLGNDLEISHVTTDIKSGELRKWGYIPTADHRYVLEVGIPSGALDPYVTELNYTDLEKNARDKTPFITELTVYDKHHIVLGRGEVETDKDKMAIIDAVITSGSDQAITADNGLVLEEYISVNTFPDRMNDSQKVVAITYNYDSIINQINKSRLATIVIFLAYTVVSLLVVLVLVRQTITKPMINLTKQINKVSAKNLDFAIPVVGTNEIGQLAQSFNDLSQKLKSTLVSKKYLENVIDSVGGILIIMDQDLRISRINQYTKEFFEQSFDNFVGRPVASLFDSDFSQSEILKKLALTPHLENIEGKMINNGRKTSVIASISVFKGEGKSVIGYILNARDISKTKQLLAKLEESNLNLKKQEIILLEQSNTDALTGVWNRGCIFNILKDIHANIPSIYATFTVIMFDLDHFKSVNDRFGHQAGDTVLIEATKIMMDSLRKTDFLGRYGGEEFLIVMPDTTLEDGYRIAERIRLKIKDTRFYNDMVDLTISGGIAEWDHTSISELIETADQLLYQAKKTGRNTIHREKKIIS